MLIEIRELNMTEAFILGVSSFEITLINIYAKMLIKLIFVR